MSRRILPLPALIANQIAAGEVIERPASVVKELLENSLDAGATSIDIEISYGGLNQIKISDNGSGIVAEDLPLAIAAHATSKITTLDDLYALDSMGFRGEALASIASIAKVTISSKPAQQEHAMALTVEGAAYHITPCARAMGTTIDVRDLFFNAPVRKRFLKSERLEFQAIEAVVKRFAFSAVHIALTLTHNNKVIFSLPAVLNETSKQQRIAKILGKEFVSNALFLDVEHASMRLWGWISSAQHQRSQSDKQWVYINQRMVRDKLIHHALKQAYDGILHPGRFPSCLLYFSLPPAQVDINVHPTKHEVRFEQPRLVHDLFVSQLTQTLHDAMSEEPVVSVAQEVCEPMPPHFVHASPILPHNTKPQHVRSLPSAMPTSRVQTAEHIAWVALNARYGILWWQQQPCLVDIIALYHAWLASQFIDALYPWPSRPLLIPLRYNVLLDSHDTLSPILSSLGLQTEQIGMELLVRTIPIALPYLDLGAFVEQLAQLAQPTINSVQSLLVLSQKITPSLVEQEVLFELNMFLSEQAEQLKKIVQPLTVEACRMLIDV